MGRQVQATACGSTWACGRGTWWNRVFVGNDSNTFWALTAGILLLVAYVGLVGVVEGSTRRRTVTTGAARHVAGAAGAVLGVVAFGHAIAFGQGNDWVGTDGFFLSGVALEGRTSVEAATSGSLLFVQIALAVVFSGVVLSALVERATYTAHVVVGMASGGLLVPVVWRATSDSGVLGSISFGDRGFVAGAATIFAMAGWLALIGAMAIGPRAGRVGSEGQLRAIPGKSSSGAAIGGLLFFAGSVGFAAIPSAAWGTDVADAAVGIAIAGSTGALAASAISWKSEGSASTIASVQGLLAGIIAVLGDPLVLTPLFALVVGAIGGAVGAFVVSAIERARIDDPVGIIAIFGSAGVWASLAVASDSLDQLLAQVVGQLILAAWSIVAGGLLFGALRVARMLRVSPELEVVGLDG